LREHILPGLVGARKLTQDQADNVQKVANETFEQIANVKLAPKQREEANRTASQYASRNTVSDFAR